MLWSCDDIQSFFLFFSYSSIYKTKIFFCIIHLQFFFIFFYPSLTFVTKHVIEPWSLLWVWSKLSVQNTEPIECNSWFVWWCAIVTFFFIILISLHNGKLGLCSSSSYTSDLFCLLLRCNVFEVSFQYSKLIIIH